MIFTLLGLQPLFLWRLIPTAWWTALALAHLAPWTPGCNLVASVNKPLMTNLRIQQDVICYQWFKQRLILSVFKPSISQWSQIKEDTVEPSVPAREFNLKAYASVTWHNDPSSLGLEPRLADHRSQAARPATLPIAPPRQACIMELMLNNLRFTNVISFVLTS